MNTIGWLLILSAILLGRAVMRGRVLNLGEDVSDAFLAIVSADTAKFTEVLSRTGDSFKATASSGSSPTTVGALLEWGTPNAKYDLGAVKPHVAAAANRYGRAYGIKTVYGWSSSGSVPNSDHPKGLALDFMVSAKTDKNRGDRLAAELLTDPSVTYVIWNKQIDSKDGKGWRPYTGPRDHTDHVHASFKAGA